MPCQAVEWEAGEGSKERGNWIGEARGSVVEETDHAGFLMNTVVVAGKALELGLEDGD